MSKDAFWFKHDAGASRDIKLLKLRHKLGYWGIGVYWTLIEILREQPDYRYPNDEDSKNLLKSMLGLDSEKFNEFIKEVLSLNLLEDKHFFIYSNSLISRMKQWESKKVNGGKGGAKRVANLKRNSSESSSETQALREEERRKEEKGISSIGALPPHRQNGNSPPTPLPPPHKTDITKEECIALIQIPYRLRTDAQNGQVYNFTTTHKDFDSDKYKPVGRDD